MKKEELEGIKRLIEKVERLQLLLAHAWNMHFPQVPTDTQRIHSLLECDICKEIHEVVEELQG